ncbi:MAG: transporter [Firmicutes bacterium]|nr:transporter [Bacillota bacterium]
MQQVQVPQTFSFDQAIRSQRIFLGWTTALTAGVLVSILLAVCMGPVAIAPAEALRILLFKLFHLNIGDIVTQTTRAHIDIIWQLRFPRVLLAVIAGAGLAMCGTAMQASVQNPLADPYILGISAGASLGATFSILLSSSGLLTGLPTEFWAFLGALAAALLVMALAGMGGQLSTVKMVLAGTIANALFLAFSNFIIYMASNAEGIRSVTFWTMGSLASAKWNSILLPAAGVFFCFIFFFAQSRNLNALLLGEEAATTLGISLHTVRRSVILVTALVTGLIVASCGIIGFVGLIIPHIVRGFVGSDHRRLLPASMLTGALLLLWADVLARTALPSGEMPIGIITSLIGAPFFMYVLFKNALGFVGK